VKDNSYVSYHGPNRPHAQTFDVELTVHLSITLANDQLNAQIFNTFITILYTYMFGAISYSSLGGQIVLTHCRRVTQICVFNTVKLGTSASSP